MLQKKFKQQKCWKTVLLIFLSAVAGCATTDRQGPSIEWVAPGEHQVVCTAAEFRDTTPVRVKFTDIWQIEEYAMYKTADSQLEVFFSKVNKAHSVTLLYQMSIADMVATWNHNSRQNIEWGEAGRIDAYPGVWFYRTYTQRDTRRSCVGFFVEWDEIFSDPKTRPGKILFGYYCNDGQQALGDQKVRTLIDGIGIQATDGIFTSRNAPPEKPTNSSAQPHRNDGLENTSALAAAKGGGPTANEGNPGFPFKFARYYIEGGGDYK